MDKNEMDAYAKKAVILLRRKAVRYTRKTGDIDVPTTTGALLQQLKLDECDSPHQRSNLKAALTRALSAAAERGLIERITGFYQGPRVTAWRYVGPEVKRALTEYRKRERVKTKTLVSALRKLGLPVRKHYQRSGLARPRTDFSASDILKAARKASIKH